MLTSITWQMRGLADRTLAQRRSAPDAPSVRVVVPARVRLPDREVRKEE